MNVEYVKYGFAALTTIVLGSLCYVGKMPPEALLTWLGGLAVQFRNVPGATAP